MPLPKAPIEATRYELRAPDDSSTGNRFLAGVAKTITKPAPPDGTKFEARWIWLTTTALTYFRFGGEAATIPVGDTDDEGSMPLLPGNGVLLNCRSHASLSVISVGAVVGFAWYGEDGV